MAELLLSHMLQDVAYVTSFIGENRIKAEIEDGPWSQFCPFSTMDDGDVFMHVLWKLDIRLACEFRFIDMM